MARRRRGRPVDGILILDKPSGITSNSALQKVKRLFGARKAGHTGSLDPLASGVLPICFGHATKISAYLLDADKAYEVECLLGVATDTGDAQGSAIETTDARPAHQQIIDKLPEFHGTMSQIPPMYSALKKDGKRLYELARQGKTVERVPREIAISKLTCEAFDGTTLRMKVNCSKGTYVRTLVEDFAKALGTLAHVTALRRTAAGPFHVDQVVTLEQIAQTAQVTQASEGENTADQTPVSTQKSQIDQLLKPIDMALPHLPAVELDSDMGFYLLNGQALQVSDAPSEGVVRLYVEGQGLVGIGEILADGRVAPRRLFKSE